MSSNISKWFPKAASQQNSDKIFRRTKNVERELRTLANKFTTNVNFNLLDYYVSYPTPFLAHNFCKQEEPIFFF